MTYDSPKKVRQIRTFLLTFFLFLTTSLTIKTFKKVNIQNIKVYGSDLFSKQDIVENSSLNLPTRLMFIKTKYAENELRRNLSLKNVSVNRVLIPFGLKIFIKERIPVAYGEQIIEGERVLGFIDDDGYFINKKYSAKKNIKQLSIKVFGWKESFIETLSKILNYKKNNEVEFLTIKFSPNGFLSLEEKNLKTIFLGFNKDIIETQLEIISNLKKELKKKNILEKIDNIDLTDPNNPKIKVFKP